MAQSARVADEAEVAEASERRHKLRAARRTAALTSLGLLAALGLALWAWYERDHALDAEREADEHARRAEKAAVRATSARNAAENLIRFMTFDLCRKLEPLGKLEFLRDARQRVDAYYELLGVLEDNPVVMRTPAANPLNSGNLQLALGDIAAAERLYGEGTESIRRLAEAEPEDLDHQRNLSVSLWRVGDAAQRAGDLEQARKDHAQARAIAEQLVERDPTNAQWQRDLVMSLEKESEEGLAEAGAARGHRQRALEILEGLKAAGKLHGEHGDRPDSVCQRLQGIDPPPN